MSMSYDCRQVVFREAKICEAKQNLKTYFFPRSYYAHTACTQMFITALLIIAPNWKQPRCPSLGEWWNKLWYIHTMEHYSAIERHELLIRNILDEFQRNHPVQKKPIPKVYMLYDFIYVTFWKWQTYGNREHIRSYQRMGEAEAMGGSWMWLLWKGNVRGPYGAGTVLCLDSSGGYRNLHIW